MHHEQLRATISLELNDSLACSAWKNNNARYYTSTCNFLLLWHNILKRLSATYHKSIALNAQRVYWIDRPSLQDKMKFHIVSREDKYALLTVSVSLRNHPCILLPSLQSPRSANTSRTDSGGMAVTTKQPCNRQK